ncbi:MAG: hypothetical protein WD069_11195 [Planctomycetales bacterium]
MSDGMKMELNDRQRETLLCGLRYVRSSLMLDVRDPDPDLDAERDGELKEIALLMDRLTGVGSRDTARV